jgi:hypothetical protein
VFVYTSCPSIVEAEQGGRSAEERRHDPAVFRTPARRVFERQLTMHFRGGSAPVAQGDGTIGEKADEPITPGLWQTQI